MIQTFCILVTVFACTLGAFDLWAATAGTREVAPWSLAAYVWVGLWGAFGGLVSFAQKVSAGTARWLNLGELFGEVLVSSFVGIVTGLLCDAAGFSGPLTYALVAITGHAGGRGIFWLERLLQKVAEKHFGVSVPASKIRQLEQAQKKATEQPMGEPHG